jgi:hypothetical protein
LFRLCLPPGDYEIFLNDTALQALESDVYSDDDRVDFDYPAEVDMDGCGVHLSGTSSSLFSLSAGGECTSKQTNYGSSDGSSDGGMGMDSFSVVLLCSCLALAVAVIFLLVKGRNTTIAPLAMAAYEEVEIIMHDDTDA